MGMDDHLRAQWLHSQDAVEVSVVTRSRSAGSRVCPWAAFWRDKPSLERKSAIVCRNEPDTCSTHFRRCPFPVRLLDRLYTDARKAASPINLKQGQGRFIRDR